jgi:hypothetical protein
MNNDGGSNFDSANGSPVEGLDERQGGEQWRVKRGPIEGRKGGEAVWRQSSLLNCMVV